MKPFLPLTVALLVLASTGSTAISQGKQMPVSPNPLQYLQPPMPQPSAPPAPEVLYEGRSAGHWLTMFKDRAASFRLQAIDALAAIGADDERVVPVLIAALDDDSGEVRTAAAGALGKIGTRGGDKVIVALKAAASQSFNKNVRTAAVRGLLCAEVGAKLVNDIESSGGTIDYVEAGKPWIRIACSSDWGDAELACLKNVSNLRVLKLEDCKVGDAGLAHLAGCKNLEQLVLLNTSVTDTGLAHLKGLRLEKLQLSGESITDAGLSHVKDMTSLRRLQLKNTAVTDAGLACLKDLVDLQALDLEASERFSDAGLVHFKNMSSLTYLNLNGTNVHNAGLEHLKLLAKLKTLKMECTYVNHEGIVSLKKSLPNLEARVSPTAVVPQAPAIQADPPVFIVPPSPAYDRNR